MRDPPETNSAEHFPPSSSLCSASSLGFRGLASAKPLLPELSSVTRLTRRTKADGITYSTVSETVTFTVVAVATLTVLPKETAPSASVVPQERITRLFRICNTGNVANTYTIRTPTSPTLQLSTVFTSTMMPAPPSHRGHSHNDRGPPHRTPWRQASALAFWRSSTPIAYPSAACCGSI